MSFFKDMRCIQSVAQLLGILSSLLGIVVLFGWATYSSTLIQLNAAFAPMPFNAALSFLICGLGILLATLGRAASLRVAGGLVFGLGTLTLLQYVTGADLHIDQLFMDDYINASVTYPGRMAPNTALCFSLVGLILLILPVDVSTCNARANAGVLGAIVFALGGVALTGYVAGIESAYMWGMAAGMAVHTAIGFVILGIGLVVYSSANHRKHTGDALPPWLPGPVAIGGITVTGGVWQAMRSYEMEMAQTLGESGMAFADKSALAFGILGTLFLTLLVRQRIARASGAKAKFLNCTPWVVLFLGLMLVLALSQVLQGTFKTNVKTRFDAAVLDQGKSLQRGIVPYLEAMQYIRSAFYATGALSKDEFRVFSQRSLEQLPGILSLQWVPVVSHETQFVLDKSSNGFYREATTSSETVATGLVAAFSKDLSFLQQFLAPIKSNAVASGDDSVGLAGIWRAIESDEVFVSGRLNLIQTDEDSSGIALLLPVYQSAMTADTAEQRREALVGFVVAVVDIGRMIDAVLTEKMHSSGLILRFEDTEGKARNKHLYTFNPVHLAEQSSAAKLWARNTISIASRDWLMSAIAADETLYPHFSITRLRLPALVLLLFLGLSIYLRRSAQREKERDLLLDKIASRERHFSMLVKTIPGTAYTYRLDENQTLTFLSDEIEKLTDYPATDFLGNRKRSFSSIIHPDDYTHVMGLVKAAIEQYEDYTVEYRIISKSGAERWVYERGQAVYDASGNPEEVHGTIIDITDRKQIEAQFRDLLENAPDSMVIIDETGQIVLVNRQTEILSGYHRDELIGNKLEMLMPKHTHSEYPKDWKRYFAESCAGTLSELVDITILSKDGREAPAEVSLSPLCTGDGMWVSAAVRDVTARKQMETDLIEAKDRAEEAAQAKSDFLANMSHEIRTPMNSIIGMSHLALQTNLTDKQFNYVDKVHRSAEFLLGIINDILDFSKIEANRLELDNSDFYLDSLLNNLAHIVGLKAEEKGLELLFNVAPDVPPIIIGDALRLGQVLTNLGANAIKFTEKGEVVISVTKVEEIADKVTLSFSVADTGIGMSAAQQQRLFRPFSQADVSTTRKYGGTGLGLVISKKLTSMMGGEISVESKLEQGSCFSFTATFGRSQATSDLVVQPPPTLGVLKVLVIDDNSTSRQILESMLISLGFIVEVCADGLEAIEQVKKSQENDPYDLIIVDWRMPGIDGIETIRQIQLVDDKLTSPACIMLTAFGRDEATTAASDVNIKDFLTKPVTPSTLLDSIMTAMGMQPLGVPSRDRVKVQTKGCQVRLAGAHILLVEDNPLNQELALELLTQSCIQVTVANNGQEALNLLAEESFDGILMDCQMPVMDGYTATGLIREQDEFKALPILAMTANTMAGDRQKALDAGMSDHIPKPINPATMFQTLANWIVPSNPQTVCDSKLSESTGDHSGLLLIGGVDTKAGLSRCRGSVGFYQRLLKGFVATQHDFIRHFQEAINQLDWEMAMRAAHDLKSSSGSIGADAIQALASELEKASVNQPSQVKLNALLDGIAPQLEMVCAAILAVCNDDLVAENVDSAAPQSHSSIENELSKLSALITAHDTEALNVAEKLLEVHSESDLAPRLELLVRQLNDWDFDAAREAMVELA